MISINCKKLDKLCYDFEYQITDKDDCYDFEYQITDKDELADKICQLLLGNCRHISKVINGLASNPRETDKKNS